jgi:hypothetical protein
MYRTIGRAASFILRCFFAIAGAKEGVVAAPPMDGPVPKESVQRKEILLRLLAKAGRVRLDQEPEGAERLAGPRRAVERQEPVLSGLGPDRARPRLEDVLDRPRRAKVVLGRLPDRRLPRPNEELDDGVPPCSDAVVGLGIDPAVVVDEGKMEGKVVPVRGPGSDRPPDVA